MLLLAALTLVSRGAAPIVYRFDPAKYKFSVESALGKVGYTEDLLALAKRTHAYAAINGCFFEAYVQGPIKPPDHSLIHEGQFVHGLEHDTAWGVDANGNMRIGRPDWQFEGTVTDRAGNSQAWYAYRINHPVTNPSVTIYTPAWGTETHANTLQAQVTNGMVTWTGEYSLKIPANGFVIAFSDGERALAARFQIGERVSYSIRPTGDEGKFWSSVVEMMGCGPWLVRDGKNVLDAESEGFTSPKVLSNSALRSVVGISLKGELMLVVTSGTNAQVADQMVKLGATDAMGLDGGGSSGIVVNGKLLTRRGRAISNAIVVRRR